MERYHVIDGCDLRKAYGEVQALDGVSLQVFAGEIVGVLGPNGAGKTTLIEVLEGLRIPDSGHVTIFGTELSQDLDSVRRRMGVCMQKTALPPALTVEEILRLYSVIYPDPISPRELLEMLGLEEKRDSLVRTLSGGQLQRLAVALAVIGKPNLLFLDEPTSELDPQGRRAVWDLLLAHKKQGKTILVNTHQMDEAQQLCDRVAILDGGQILGFDSPKALIARHCPGNVLRFATSTDANLALYGGSFEGSERNGTRTRHASIRTATLETDMQRLMSARSQGNLLVEELSVETSNLEDVFLQITGRGFRD